ncbi:hypothetical protein D3C87_1368540 [compost metagenome]
MHDPWPAIAFDQAPEIIHLAFAGTGLGTENLAEAFYQAIATEGATNHPAQGAEQQFLHQDRTVGFREQAAIEEHTTGEVDARFVMPGQQFLGHAVAIIMGEYVHGLLDMQMGQQRLLQIGLLQQAVFVVHRFGRVAEAEHVAGNHPVALRQRLPEVMPVPTGSREAVDEQQRLTLPCRPVMDGLTMELERLAAFAPDTQRDLGEWH